MHFPGMKQAHPHKALPTRSKSDQGRLVKATRETYEFLRNDETYLLRLCQKADWANVEKCCSILSRVFKSKSYEELTAGSKKQLLARDQWGNATLHVACFHKPPTSTVKALLKAASRAPGGPIQLHTLVNEKGASPLVIACKSGASRQTIQILLNPPKCLLPGGTMVTVYDNQGSSPFLGMMNRYDMLRKIPAYKKQCIPLEQVDSDIIVQRSNKQQDYHAGTDDDDNNNINVSLSHDVFLADTLILADLSDCFSHSSVDGGSSKGAQILPLFWKNIEDLMQAAWQSAGHSPEDFSPLYGAALVSDGLPRKLVDLVLRLVNTTNTNTNKDVDQDQEQVSPLQLALLQSVSSCHPTVGRAQHAYFVQRLLELDSSNTGGGGAAAAIDVAAQSSRGGDRSTFCQAIASGLVWNVSSTTSSTSSRTTSSTSSRTTSFSIIVGQQQEEDELVLLGPVQALFQYYPDALLEQDVKTGLYPFQLAANVARKTIDTAGGAAAAYSNKSENFVAEQQQQQQQESDHDAIEDAIQLDTIYNLLRKCPGSINSY